jgi:hypothetical protein
MHLHRILAPLALGLMLATAAAAAPKSAAPVAAAPKSKFAEATAGLDRREGLLPVYVDKAQGRILVALPAPDAEGVAGRFLYQTYLRDGMGSNPVGLDRSKPGDTQILVFRRAGRRVVAEFENWTFRAERGSADEKKAVRQSFAVSTVWSGEIAAEGPDGGLLVDLTPFLLRDAFNISGALKDARQGGFRLDSGVSYADTGSVQAFPENIELDVSQTFTSDDPGPEVRGIAPDPRAMTVAVHHSLIRLPNPGYKPRVFDPRSGAFNQIVVDYSAPLDQPLTYRLAQRFRLEKVDPTAARSRVKKPIVFYVDRSAPEPVRSALVEGAAWWAKAFEAAGFIDAFRVEVLPEGVSPLDARYNVINWVHRQTRGWSYGQGVVDPRTGEVIKGSVLLGSQRIRQDRLIFEGLAGAAATGKGGPNDPVQVSLARLRQLSAHETGHALGILHNFAGSTFDNRATVMDYPPPRVTITSAGLDFSDAYGVGVGSWDRFAVSWLYGEFSPGTDEARALNDLATRAYASGLRFVSDEDARIPGVGQPWGSLWDDGPDPVEGLNHVMAVRRHALGNFGLGGLHEGAAVHDLKRLIVPIYLFHRYQVEAAAKLVGGVDFNYAVKGDGLEASRPVPADRQRAAVAALLLTVEPAELDVPAALNDLMNAGQPGNTDPQTSTELFDSGGAVFSLPTAADVAADMTYSSLFATQRLNRLADLNSRDPQSPGVAEVVNLAIDSAFAVAKDETPRRAELRRRVQARLVFDLAATLEDKALSPSAAAQVRAALVDLGKRLQKRKGDGPDAAQARYFADLLLEENQDRLRNLAAANRRAPVTPPGMPIGEEDWFGDLVR